MTMVSPTQFMSLALALAEQGRFGVSPNPMVGCVIVKDELILGRGFHQERGKAHAEVFALEEAGENAKGASLYVTLEPCAHQGKTPPCVNAIIQAGIQKVYVACLDPNPLVSGKGIEKLRAAGIAVEIGLCEEAASKLNEIFFHYIRHQRPFVIAKWAMSLNGKTSIENGENKQISSEASQIHTHTIRKQVDAILVGAKTASLDNPQLSAREIPHQTLAAKQPLRIVLAGQTELSPHLTLFNTSQQTLIAATKRSVVSLKQIKNTEILLLPENKEGKICLHALLKALGEREISSLLVEGGMRVHESFFKENLVNQCLVYVAPLFIGAKKQAISIEACTQLEKDFHFIATLQETQHV